MAVNLSPIWGAGAQLLDNSGNVLSGGKIYTYAAGTTTPAATYTSSNGLTANSNPIILNSAGRVPYEIWLTDGVSYKFVLKDSNDVLIATYDNLTGINSNFIAYTAQQEIQTATAGQTVFTLTTMQYQPATNNLSVFVDGVNQYGPGAQYAYVETDSTTVTFVSGLHVGASVKFTTATSVSSSSTDAQNVSYEPPFTGSVAESVATKLAQTVSVKDFGAAGDGVTDDTAAIQAAYDYIANEGKGKIEWPTATYKVDGTIYIPSNSVTDLCNSVIVADGQNLFETGYLSGGALITNSGTSNSVYTVAGGALFGTQIGNGKIQNAGVVFTLYKFLANCHIYDIEILDADQVINASYCFYSNYSRIIRFQTVSLLGTTGTANTTLGSSTVTIANATAAQLSSGMQVGATWVPYGTTISSVGAADSGGSGLTNVVLNQNAYYTLVAGAINSGFVASQYTTPEFQFNHSCSNLVFTKVSAGGAFIGFDLQEVSASTFISCDTTGVGYGYRLRGGCAGNEFTGMYVEGIYRALFDFSENTSGGGSVIGVSNGFQVSTLITAGFTGYVSGTLTIANAATGFTPYGFSSNGGPIVDLSSPNAKLIVLGGNTDTASQFRTNSNSIVLNQNGLCLPNIAAAYGANYSLSWYEQGTWNPVIEGQSTVGVGTYTTQYGTYTRIGNRVFATINVNWSAHTGTGNLVISGMPYLSTILTVRGFPVTPVGISYTAGDQFLMTTGGASWTKFNLTKIDTAGSSSAVGITASGQLFATIEYQV